MVAINPAAAALFAAFLPIRNLTLESDASSVLSPPAGHRWLHYITLSAKNQTRFAVDASGRNLFTVGFPVSANDGRRRTGSLHRRGGPPHPPARGRSGAPNAQPCGASARRGGPRTRRPGPNRRRPS